MKKNYGFALTLTLTLTLTCLLTIFSNATSAKQIKEKNPLFEGQITTLIINADVSVVLVGSNQSSLEVVGGNDLQKNITFKQTGDTLVISSRKNKNLKNLGVIYVPAGMLRNILINSESQIRTLYTLHIPKLDVVINGVCDFDIANIGEVNLTSTEKYTYEHTTTSRRVPGNMFKQ